MSGVLGRAQRLYPVSICGVVVASNHYHLLVRAPDAVRQLFWEGYALFVATYRNAAERLKAGDTAPPFPAGCFPPAMPFVSG